MNKIALVYWSGTGNTQAMANFVVDGAKEASCDIDLFTTYEFGVEKLNEYDIVVFGCPAMGAEDLEDSEFGPMFDKILPLISGKKIALFGSYGWGGGEWMSNWEQKCISAGANIICESVISNEAPDDTVASACKKMGLALSAN